MLKSNFVFEFILEFGLFSNDALKFVLSKKINANTFTFQSTCQLRQGCDMLSSFDFNELSFMCCDRYNNDAVSAE